MPEVVPDSATPAQDQPEWRLVLLVAAACGCLSVGSLNLPWHFGAPALLVCLVCGLCGLEFWRKAVGVLVPHILCAIILVAGLALRSVSAAEAMPALILHCSIAVGILVCALVGKRFLFWGYLLAALPAGLAMSDAWGQFLTHRWNGTLVAVWVVMVIQIAGVVSQVQDGAVRLLVLSLLMVAGLLGNQSRWLGDQIRLLRLHDAFQSAQAGTLKPSGPEKQDEAQPFHWGAATATFHVTWIIGPLEDAQRITAQAEALLSLEPLIEARQVDLTVLVQDQSDPTATNLADAAMVLLPPREWLGLLSRERTNDVNSWLLQALTAIKGGTVSEDPLLAYVRCTRRIADLRQAIRARTAESGLPTNTFIRVSRGPSILRQGLDLVDAAQLRALVSPPGVHP